MLVYIYFVFHLQDTFIRIDSLQVNIYVSLIYKVNLYVLLVYKVDLHLITYAYDASMCMFISMCVYVHMYVYVCVCVCALLRLPAG